MCDVCVDGNTITDNDARMDLGGVVPEIIDALRIPTSPSRNDAHES